MGGRKGERENGEGAQTKGDAKEMILWEPTTVYLRSHSWNNEITQYISDFYRQSSARPLATQFLILVV